MKSTPRVPRYVNHPCMFRGELIREADRKIAYEWAKKFTRGAPFSRLRLSWKEQHCRILNRYSSKECPYPERDCVISFLSAVETAIWDCDEVSHAVGYFRAIIKTMALNRLENKPLARERPGLAGTPQLGSAAGPYEPVALADGERGDGTGGIRGIPEEPNLRRSHARPLSIGEVLGTLNVGTRKTELPNGEEGRK